MKALLIALLPGLLLAGPRVECALAADRPPRAAAATKAGKAQAVGHPQSAGKPETASAAAGFKSECRPPPPTMRVKVSFRPDTEVADLLVWYSTFTCTSITVGGGITLAGKKISILSPTPVTRAEVDQLFLGALESVGLTIAHEGRFLTVIDAARARHSNTPIVMPPHQQR